jgi:hypothetical protein
MRPVEGLADHPLLKVRMFAQRKYLSEPCPLPYLRSLQYLQMLDLQRTIKFLLFVWGTA